VKNCCLESTNKLSNKLRTVCEKQKKNDKCCEKGFRALEGFGCCWVLGFLRVLLGSLLWASWVLPLYIPCVLRGALRFFNEIPITYKKKSVLKK
jgi:hypothetical protein